MRYIKQNPFCIKAVIILLLLSSGLLLGADKEIWPVDTKPAITSSFGEFRPGHFHAGVDLKLYGRIGDPCRAVDDGWVSRIKVTPTGYGRALYLKLKDGRTAVYAHLDRFASEVEEIVRQEQEACRGFEVELFFETDSAVHFKRGDVVAYAGRSGTKHPHVHFEIRDDRERPMNALLHGITIGDNIPPNPVALAIEPLDGYSTVELDCQPRIYAHLVRRNDGIWGPRDPVGASGRIGVSVDAYDKMEAAENLLAVYTIQMYVNGELRWETRFDEFSYSESRQIETERNYRLHRRGKGLFHRLYRNPGNELDFCRGNGVIDVDSAVEFPLEVAIILGDAAGNQSRIEFDLVPDAEPDDDRLVTGEPMIPVDGWGSPARDKIILEIFDNYIRFAGPPGIDGINLNGNMHLTLLTQPLDGYEAAIWIPPADLDGQVEIAALDREGRAVELCTLNLKPVFPSEPAVVKSDDGQVRVELPPGTVYDTTWVRVIPEPSYVVPGEIETVYRIEPRDQPLRSEVTIELYHNDILEYESRWGVYYLDKRKGWTFLGNTPEEEYLTAPALSWEIFGLVRDPDLPYLRINQPQDGGIIKSAEFYFEASVYDTTSGIIAEGITVTIDDEKVPAEYDPPRKRVLYKPWKELADGSHLLTVSVVDRVGNEAVRTVNFNIQP